MNASFRVHDQMTGSSRLVHRWSPGVAPKELFTAAPAIVLLREGRMRIRTSSRELKLNSGEIGLLDAGIRYTIEDSPSAGGEFFVTTLLVSSDTLAGVQQHRSCCGDTFTSTSEVQVRAAIDHAILALSDALLPPPLKECAVREVLLHLREKGICFSAQEPTPMDRLRGLIAAEPDFEWTMASAGRALATSKKMLGNQLTASGISFQALLADIRMTHALSLLETTTLPIKRIAVTVGYATRQRFADRFRARFGVSPSEFRRTQSHSASSCFPC